MRGLQNCGLQYPLLGTVCWGVVWYGRFYCQLLWPRVFGSFRVSARFLEFVLVRPTNSKYRKFERLLALKLRGLSQTREAATGISLLVKWCLSASLCWVIRVEKEFCNLMYHLGTKVVYQTVNSVTTSWSASSNRRLVQQKGGVRLRPRNLVDPASSHMLVSKIKPCMSQNQHYYS